MNILDSLIKRLVKVFSTEDYVVQEIEEAIAFSDASWAKVNKSKLPAQCFLIVGDMKKKTTWHLPYREGAGGIDPNTGLYRKAGPVNKGAIRALLALFGGSRGGIKNFSVPAAVKAKVQALAKQAGIGAIVVHALSEKARGFYLRHGFLKSPMNQRTLMLSFADWG